MCPDWVRTKRGCTVGKPSLSDAQLKALTLEFQRKDKKPTNVALAKKYKVSEKTIRRAKVAWKKRLSEKKPSILEMKLALETSKADSALMWLMDSTLEDQKEMNRNSEKFSPDKRIASKIKTMEIILTIRNSLAFTEVPMTVDDYTDNDVAMMEWLMDNLPENKKEEMLARFTDKPPAESGGEAVQVQ